MPDKERHSMLGLHNLKVRSFVLDADDYFHKDKLKSGSRLSRPSWLGADFSPLDFGKSRGFTHQSHFKTLSQGDVRNLLLQRESTPGNYFRLAYRRLALKQILFPGNPVLRIHIWQQLFLLWARRLYQWALMFYRMHGNNRRAHIILWSSNVRTLPASIRRPSVGLSNRFDIQRDVDYRSFKAQLGGVPWTEALQILWLSLQESIAIRRSPSDTLNRLVQRGLRSSEGKAVLRLGLRGYLRFKLLGQEPKNRLNFNAFG